MPNPLKETATRYGEHKLAKLSASLSYYAIFSMGPIILIMVILLGLIYGQEAAAGRLQTQVAQFTSERIGAFVQMIVQNTNLSQGSIIQFVIAGLLLLFGATTVVADMQDSLNTIWGVRKSRDAGIGDTLMIRVRSLLIIAVAAALILAAVLMTAIVPKFLGQLEEILSLPAIVIQAISYAISLALVWVLFMFVFKYLPDVELGFGDVSGGALVTAILFVVGQWLITYYLGQSGAADQFGPAGAAVAFLIWVYYSSQVFYIGAEFTRAWYQRRGRDIRPIHHTERLRQPQPVR